MSDQDAWQLSHSAAGAYERDFVPALFAQWPPIMAEVAQIGPGDRVLDVACGTGVLARGLLAHVGPQGRVSGLDLNDGMLAEARRIAPAVDWRQGNATALPFDDGAFDVVVSQFAMMFFPDPVAALKEIHRVLTPGGRLAVAVCAPIATTRGYRVLAQILRAHAGSDAAAMLEGYFSLGDEAKLLQLGRAAGLVDARVIVRDGIARFASIEELLRIEIKGSPLAALVDAADYERIREVALMELREFCDPEGRVAMRLDASILVARRS